MDISYYEAFNILFRFENSLRVFVYVILKNERGLGWTDVEITTQGGESRRIESIARQRIGQASNFGYLGYDVTCPIMHLTSGELIGILTSESLWPKFKDHFRGSKEIIKNKFLEIVTVRNSLAHFRPIKADDISLLEQGTKHTLMAVEECLNNMLSTSLVTPTNCQDEWYKKVGSIGSEYVKFNVYQSGDGKWIRLCLMCKSHLLGRNQTTDNFQDFRNTTLKTPNILTKFTNLREHVTFATENSNYWEHIETENPNIWKAVNFVFLRGKLERHFESIETDLREMARVITEETALVTEDNLAQGEIVTPVNTIAYLQKDSQRWNFMNFQMKCPFKHDDPPEYWGSIGEGHNDFISSTTIYPWMEVEISKHDPY